MSIPLLRVLLQPARPGRRIGRVARSTSGTGESQQEFVAGSAEQVIDTTSLGPALANYEARAACRILMNQWSELRIAIDQLKTSTPGFSWGAEWQMVEDASTTAQLIKNTLGGVLDALGELREGTSGELIDADFPALDKRQDSSVNHSVFRELNNLHKSLRLRTSQAAPIDLVDQISILGLRARRLESQGTNFSDLFYNIVNSTRRQIIEEVLNPGPTEQTEIEKDWPAHREQLLRSIGEIAVRVAETRSELDREVTLAHSAGVNWSEIGRAVGVSPQAARRRWDPEAKAKFNEYQRKRTRKRADPVREN